MKQTLLALVSATLAALGTPHVQAAKVSVDFFYDALEPHGEWIEAGDYGYVWHPRDVDREWRPYSDGNWAYTDAGWTWVSEEPFAWATYHYGRWMEIETTGWVWVPDTTWGPAWVSWRRNKTHVGWAPLPPEARFEARVGFRGWVDSYYDIGPTNYSFVKVRDFGAPRLRTVLLPPRDNLTIINQTTNITNITYTNNVVINNGPDYDVIVRESAQPVRRLKLERRTEIEADVRSARRNTEVTGGTLRVLAPEMEASPTATVKPKKVARKLERLEVDRGWRNAGDAAQVKEARAKLSAESKAPEGLPPKPQLRGSDAATAAPAPAKPAVGSVAPDAEKPAANTAGADAQTKTPPRDPPGDMPPPDAKKPDTTAQQPRKPGTTPQQPDATQPGATAQQPAKPGEDATAQQPDAGRPGATPKQKGDARREDRPGIAKKKPGEDQTVPVAEDPSGQRPEANRQNREQPGARKEAKPEINRPQTPPEQKPQDRATEESTPPRPGPTRTEPGARPGAERPDRPRPEAGRPDSPRPDADRTERPSPQAERPVRPERRAPAEPPQRSPERARPEGAERSPQNRPPAADRPDRPDRPATPAAKDKGDETKKEKKEQPESL